MDHHLLAFLAVATLVTITPGADMALVTRNVLSGGTRAGLETSAGVLSGLVAWAFLAAVGLAALLAASAAAFTLLKLVGAAYLLYLGVTTLWRARRTPTLAPVLDGRTVAPRFADNYRQGLLSNLLNPKVGVFYTTFLPAFVEPGHSAFAWTATLAGLHIAMGVVWLAFYSWLVSRARAALARPGARRLLDRITGLALVALGLRVAKGTA